MPTRLFTDDVVASLPTPRSGRREIGDARLRGLVLRTTECGAKSWSVIYKVPGERGMSISGRPLKGRQHRITLGPFPLWNVAKAREEAAKVLARVEHGVDPREERREEAALRYGNTVADVADRMIEDAKATVSSWSKIETTLTTHVVPRIGQRPIADITRADVEALLDTLKSERSVATAREVRKHLSRLLNFAHSRDLIAATPMAGMRRRDLQYQPKDRVLNNAELKALWHSTDTLGYPYGPAIRLLLLTGQRKSEWLNATWAEIDRAERTLTVAAARHKSRRGHIVPLTAAAMAIVDELPGSRGALFIGRTGKMANGSSKVEARLREAMLARMQKDDPEATLPMFTLHDLRRTCETRMAQLGVPQQVCEAVLGHSKPGLRRTYNKYDYLTERREALTMYAKHLEEVCK